MLHLTKLAVGARDVEHLRAWQAERALQLPPLRHRTRNFPRRAAEVVDGGSMYWVLSGAMLVRQRVLDIMEDRWDDGRSCTAIVLHPDLVMVAARATTPRPTSCAAKRPRARLPCRSGCGRSCARFA